MEHCIGIHSGCPIEKSPGGPCFEGEWLEVNPGIWVFKGLWKCPHFNYETKTCMLMEENNE